MNAQYDYGLAQLSDFGALMGDCRVAMLTPNNIFQQGAHHDFRYIKIPKYRWVRSQLIEVGILWSMVNGIQEWVKVFFANSCYGGLILVRFGGTRQEGSLWHLADESQSNLRSGDFYDRFKPYPRYADPNFSHRFARDYEARMRRDWEEVYGLNKLGALIRPFDKVGVLVVRPHGRLSYHGDPSGWFGVSACGRFANAEDQNEAIENRQEGDDTMTANIATRAVSPNVDPRQSEWNMLCYEAQQTAGIRNADLQH